MTTAQEAAQAAAETAAGSGAREITLTVNGEAKKLTVEPRVTLLEALRNDLKYTGCKEVCTTANCGACTVLIDGKPVYACTRFAVAEAGKKIETPEAYLGKKPDAVIEGYIKHDATQCGYCTPGFVMATRAFLNEHPHATLEEIQKGLGGNLCRCGTYANITHCAMEIAKNGKGGA
ncbi:MAG: (2Fe-2S)-binding protein [Planctomycetales bacterium]